MEFCQVIKKRRSIRKFDNRPVEREKIEHLLQCAFLSPSSHNHRPWHFVVVQNRDLLDRLSQSKPGAQGLHNAQAAIVVCAYPNKSDVWIEDAAIAAHTINLAAVDLGLGSFWVQIRNRYFDENTTAARYVRNLLNLPQDLEVLSIIGLGYPLKNKPENQPHIEWDKVTWIETANPDKT